MTLLFLHIINFWLIACKIICAVLLSMLALLIVKMFTALTTKNAIVNSKALNKHETASLSYLLPKALLKITTTAKVRIEENENTNAVIAQVLSQQFEIEPKIIGDKGYPVALEYKTHFLYNDVVSFTVGENGLLQTVNTKVKDETSTIVKSITAASKQILTPVIRTTEGIPPAQATKVSIREYKNEITIDPGDTQQSIAWNQVVGNEGSTNVENIDLGFELAKDSNNNPLEAEVDSGKDSDKKDHSRSYKLESFAGIYSRPVVTNKFVITPNAPGLKNISSFFYIGMPDSENILRVPLTRGHFIEKTNNLILTNGLVTSNSIIKPSELVGFVSIPIDILKAIVSIPAQLLTFTINRTTQLKNLEEQKGLLATEIINNENAQLTRDLKLQQEIKKSQEAIAESEKNIVEAQKAIVEAVKGIGGGK